MSELWRVPLQMSVNCRVINVCRLARHDFEAEVLAVACTGPQARVTPLVGVSEIAPDPVEPHFESIGRTDIPSLAVHNGLGDAIDVRHDAGETGRHGFQDREWKTLI